MTTVEAQKLMQALKVTTISIPVATTSLGQLSVNLRKDENEWFFTLDAVPVLKDLNEDLKKVFNYN